MAQPSAVEPTISSAPPRALGFLLALLLALMLVPDANAGAALNEPIKPVPLSLHQDPARVDLGRRLFNDARLSANNKVSCASCHDLARGGGADGRTRSPGFSGRLTEVNTPTVFNAALNFRQFWNGRADTLETQIEQVVQNQHEMGSNWAQVVVKVAQDAGYARSFAAAYKDGVTAANIRQAIASYERTLITPNSRFDQYLRGDVNAISAAEKTGYARFKQYGCVACHQGVNVGGNMYQKFGVMGDYFAREGKNKGNEADQGRFLVTHAADDLHVFKVPGLRNVAETGPYFHDGSAATLEQAIDVMFQYQLGRVGSKEDKEFIVKFLKTLSGKPTGQP